MTFKAHYEQAGSASLKKEEIPVQAFLERIPPELALELYVVSAYSDSQALVDIYVFVQLVGS
jgi:hypothetical protein